MKHKSGKTWYTLVRTILTIGSYLSVWFKSKRINYEMLVITKFKVKQYSKAYKK